MSHLYTPRVLELRLSSRVMVELLTPIAFAISFLVHFFCSNTEIVYLCSEVSCLYISNAKLTNLWETAVSLYCFFALPVNSRRSARGEDAPLRYAPGILLPLAGTPSQSLSKNCTSIWKVGEMEGLFVILLQFTLEITLNLNKRDSCLLKK